MFIKGFFTTLFLLATLGCGVKGKPLPPEQPIRMGLGQPKSPTTDRKKDPRSEKSDWDELEQPGQ